MMKNIKTYQETKEKLKGNVGAGLNKVVCVVLVLILIVLVCVGGFYWYRYSKNKVLNPLEQSGEKIESGELIEIGLQVGDYVSYAADIDADVAWRVWKIEGDNVVIVPAKPQGYLTLEGAEDWLNAEEKIEDKCDKYVNSSLGITAENIRSMKIEDIEEVIPATEVTQAKNDFDYRLSHIYTSGTFYAEKANGSSGTFDGYNKALSSSKSAVTLVNTYWCKTSPTWNELNNMKTGITNDTYGNILGTSCGWLASRCVNCDSDYADFGVRYVSSNTVDFHSLYYSDGVTLSLSFGVRPLVSLDSKLFNGEGKGTWNNSWQLGEIERTNGGTSGNLSGDELMAMGLQVGDYVSYTADNNKIADWRVWKIEEDNIVIVPTEPLGDLNLEGAEDWLNAEEKIESECDKYVNSSLGITAKEIRSMKIEDIEEVLPEEKVESVKLDGDYGKEYSYENGTFYAEKADADTFDGYNKKLSTPKIASSSNPVKLKNTYWYKSILTWNKLDNTKSGMESDTYGTILGDFSGWLASRCVNCYFGHADFDVRYVYNDSVYGNDLYDSDGYASSSSNGVRPLVTLDSKLFNGTGEGTSDNPWKLNG